MHNMHTEIVIKGYVLNCWPKRTVTPLLVLVNFDYGLKDCWCLTSEHILVFIYLFWQLLFIILIAILCEQLWIPNSLKQKATTTKTWYHFHWEVCGHQKLHCDVPTIPDLTPWESKRVKGCTWAGGKAQDQGSAGWYARLRRLQIATDQLGTAHVTGQPNTMSTELRHWCHDPTRLLFI